MSKRKIVTTILLALLLTLCFSMTAFADDGRTDCLEYVYATTNASIRTQPSESAEEVLEVAAGTVLVRTAVLDNGWSELYGAYYVSSKLITTQPINAAAVPTAATTTQAVNAVPKTVNGVTLTPRGTTPRGLPIYYSENLTDEYEDFMIAAYDATGITNDMSDYDKVIAINNYVCNTLEYDWDLHYGRVPFRPGTELRQNSLLYGRGECGEYMSCVRYLCTMAGIYCRNATSFDHGWNLVIIDDVYYWVDACWNDTSRSNKYLMSTTLWDDIHHKIWDYDTYFTYWY